MDAARKRLPQELHFTGINRISGNKEGTILLEARDATPVEPDVAISPFFWRSFLKEVPLLLMICGFTLLLAHEKALVSIPFVIFLVMGGVYSDVRDAVRPYDRFTFTEVMELSPQEEHPAYAHLYHQCKLLLGEEELHKFQRKEGTRWGVSSLALDEKIDALYEEHLPLKEEVDALEEAQEEVAVRRLYSGRMAPSALEDRPRHKQASQEQHLVTGSIPRPLSHV